VSLNQFVPFERRSCQKDDSKQDRTAPPETERSLALLLERPIGQMDGKAARQQADRRADNEWQRQSLCGRRTDAIPMQKAEVNHDQRGEKGNLRQQKA
jgi:hypothetical protein